MRTIGDFHEIIQKLMECAEFFQEHDELERMSVLHGIVEQMYNQHLELANGLKETDPYFVSLKYIKEWLDENKTEVI